ncbi:BTB POZ domain-containing protein [Rutstroemia sp. NJR-2017a BBW]|nr:BTB POZ domain-containing protein [Rutstroemia sp. NJR-2017a BBW]
MFLSKNEDLGRALGEDIVTIFVGPARRKFVLHKNLLCRLPFFDYAFNGGFQETVTGSMDLPEDEPDIFSIFVHWVYRGSVPPITCQKNLDDLLSLYIFAEKLCLNELCNRTLDEIQGSAEGLEKVVFKFGVVQMRKIWENTAPDSPLRTWSVYATLWLCCKFDAKIEEDRPIARAVLVQLWDVFKDHCDFYERFFVQVGKHSESNLPRNAFELNDWVVCAFHRHAEGEQCYLAKAGLEDRMVAVQSCQTTCLVEDGCDDPYCKSFRV